MRVLLLGDCHGQLGVVHQACRHALDSHAVEAAIQMGDFGFFPKILHKFIHEGPRRFPLPLHVIDGNHEDHSWLNKCKADGTIEAWREANLHWHDRGTTAEFGGLQFGFLGGALHADRRQEWAGQWPPDKHQGRRVPRDPVWANWITEGQMERALAAFSATPPDVLVTHSCPAGIGLGMAGELSLIEDVDRFISRAGHSSGPFHDCGEHYLTRIWREIPRRPRLWMYGHFHRLHQKRMEETDYLCCGLADKDPVDPLLILDTESLKVERYP